MTPSRAPRRTLRTVAVAAVLAAAALAACRDDPPPAPPQQQQIEQPAQEAPPVQVLTLSAAELGGHLEATEWVAGVMEWIAELQDPALSALSSRALWNDGRIFIPTADSPSGETFWLHIFTDVSAESARAWLEYLALQPPSTALSFTSPEHDLIEALAVAPPPLGSAALAVRLLHGNAGGRYRTEVIVFAQSAAVVFLCNSRRAAAPRLTNLPQIATLISNRLQ